MSSFMDNPDGEFYVLDSYSVDDMDDNDSIIRIQWKEGGIKCPITQCNIFCTSRQTFASHWEEIHRQWYNYQMCPKCGHQLRRFIELQQHMRKRHGFLEKDFSAVLSSVKIIRKMNLKYINPGQYRPPIIPNNSDNHSSMIKLLQSSSSSSSSTNSKSARAKDSDSPKKSQSSSLSAKRKSSSSSSTHATAVIKPKVQKKDENEKSKEHTSSSKFPAWNVPDIPSSRQVLIDYVKWADSVICQVGNARLEAKRRLDALDTDSELQKERKLRKKLEKELESIKAELEALRHLNEYTSFGVS